MTITQPDTRFEPAEAAVVVIDVQNDFCDQSGGSATLGKDLSAVPSGTSQLMSFLDAAREMGVPVILVRTTHDESTDSEEWLMRYPGGRRRFLCMPGTWGAEFYGISPQPGDVVVTKHRYNAFTSEEFVAAVKSLGRKSLLFTGIATSICVESTARDATSRDYLVTIVSDCCMDYSTADHEASLHVMGTAFGRVARSEEILSVWRLATAGR